ncbi:MAG TPA: adenosylcobinamide-GDP ribazoletransferase [Polyangia bacterium]|nr:adenosylcobinamide-GDP ribazoletransferase [Polyangia bacterium]
MRPLVAAFAFLTRLPVWSGPLRDVDLGRSLTFFPVVGLVLGLVLRGTGSLLVGVVEPTLAAVVLVALLAALTGGLHLDGVADVFDGLGGGRGDKQRTLDIMRDSHIGAHGAAALVLLLLAKVFAVAELLARRDLACLLVFPAVARWAVTPAIVFHPYARPEGLGRAFNGEARSWEVAGATAILALAIGVIGPRFIAPAAGALVAASLLALWLRRRLGGLTGDVYGAAIELAEVATLAIAGAMR